jgi:flagellar motility protein MotE (MotC chaperone)
MLAVLGKLPFVGDLFTAASEKVKSLGNAIGDMAEQTRQASADAIQAAHDKQDATQAELENTLTAIDAESQARRAALDEQKQANEEVVQNEAEVQTRIVELTKAANEEIKKSDEELENAEQNIRDQKNKSNKLYDKWYIR